MQNDHMSCLVQGGLHQAAVKTLHHATNIKLLNHRMSAGKTEGRKNSKKVSAMTNLQLSGFVTNLVICGKLNSPRSQKTSHLTDKMYEPKLATKLLKIKPDDMNWQTQPKNFVLKDCFSFKGFQ